jgi:hypothetical protein
MWSAGATLPGSSRLHSVTSISVGRWLLLYVKGVPQPPQKLRRTLGDELKTRGVSPVKARSPIRTVNQPTTGAAQARRQDSQWHNVGGHKIGPQR